MSLVEIEVELANFRPEFTIYIKVMSNLPLLFSLLKEKIFLKRESSYSNFCFPSFSKAKTIQKTFEASSLLQRYLDKNISLFIR